MILTGKIIDITDGHARVSVKRQSACGDSCEKCGGCSAMEKLYIDALNEIEAPIGADVEISFEENVPLGLAFLVYILPFVLCFIGYVIGITLLGNYGGIPGAILGIAIWIFFLIKGNKETQKKQKYKGVIQKIL